MVKNGPLVNRNIYLRVYIYIYIPTLYNKMEFNLHRKKIFWFR